MRSIYLSFFVLEFKKWMGYRVDFWLQFVANLFVEVSIAYFLWDSIFTFQGVSQIGGFSFDQMLVYYVIGSFVGKMIRTGDEMQMSREIYEGTLTNVLLYPLSTLWLKLVVKFSYAALAYTQFLLCVIVLPFFIQSFTIDVLSLVVGTYLLLYSIALAYLLNMLMELIAFWFENVWTMIVLMRFVTQFLGGAYLPISLYPQKVQDYLSLSPFPYTFSTPVKTLMGDWSLQIFIKAQVISVVWIIALSLLLALVWKRGQLKYTGAGQ
ncbi:MAG: ABC-2 family transporter protein [Bdellovibrionales bacterium]|nr:ABC-2 family transporter protein [Bdellovibrionales bacterium]